MKQLFILFFAFLIFTSCIHSKIKNYGVDKIEFGSGGGITGRYITYTVDLRQRVILNSDQSVKKSLSKKEFNILLKKLKDTDFSKIEFNHPHNMSYFLNFEVDYINKIVWGDPSYPAPGKAKELYSYLIELAN
jgi:hypothetical protein